MTYDAGEAVWRITVPVLSSATQLDMVFNDGAGTWDNNGGQDWHFVVTAGQPGHSWEMDGSVDAEAILLASNGGIDLYAGISGDVLYVATWDAGEGNDHFIFLANPPGSMQPSPWAKSGQVAGWAAYLGNENDNGWSGWFDTAAATDSATGGGSGYLEGTIDLTEEFAALPETIHLAVALYPTADGAELLHEYQVPASINSDINVDPGEFLMVPTCDIRIDHAAADFDKNCVIDLADYVILAQCLAGPGAGQAPACPPDTDTDLDDDGDVDLVDFGLFQIAFGG